jgi:Effector-associated domain 1/CHAT domain
MKLSSLQRKKLQSALLSAFSRKSSLEQMLSHELEEILHQIPLEGRLNDIVFELIKETERCNLTEKLVRAAREENPGDEELKAVEEELFPLEKLEQKITILILAGSPQSPRLDKDKHEDPLRLDIEIREIQDAIKQTSNRDLFEVYTRIAVRPDDVRREIEDKKPQIVHFCGHGSENGSLFLEDEAGNYKTVSRYALASIFELHKDYVKCVLLNACHSEIIAEEIHKHIDYVIGMNYRIKDKAAIAFAKGFYDRLSYKSSRNKDVFEIAFNEGVAAVGAENLTQVEVPVFFKPRNSH